MRNSLVIVPVTVVVFVKKVMKNITIKLITPKIMLAPIGSPQLPSSAFLEIAFNCDDVCFMKITSCLR